MAEATKYQLVPNNQNNTTNNNNNNIVSELRSHFTLFRNRKSSAFIYGVIFVFIVFSIFLAFSPSSSSSTSSSSWFINIFTLNSTTPATTDSSSRSPDFSPQISDDTNPRSHNNAESPTPISQNLQNLNETQLPPDKVDDFQFDYTSEKISPQISPQKDENLKSNDTNSNSKTPEKISPKISPLPPTKVENFNPSNVTNSPEKQSNQTTVIQPQIPENSTEKQSNQTKAIQPQISPQISPQIPEKKSDQSSVVQPQIPPPISPQIPENSTKISSINANNTVSGETEKKQGNETEKQGNETEKKQGNETEKKKNKKKKSMIDSLVDCDLYDGEWIRDESYPLYKPGSCKLVDEQFNCILNGRPDSDYQKFKWKPKGCTLPRLKGNQMLKLLRGKRLVFVGDSLNRNMWESLVCILKSAVKNPKNVYEAYGRHYFRTEASYSFVFKDYNCTVEFFVAPFLVQQWEVKEKNGTIKETLRLDLVVRDSDHFKNADVVIFNTGHWWTHEKTSKGEDYYQEGSHVYQQLDVQEAFRKAITTWGRWIDANINPQKTHVFFRGYSSTHFRGGQWNSGGQCDSETEPIRNETYLTKYPWKMKVLENVIKNMKTPVSYLNITKLTDYRKDAHPSVYRKQQLSVEEKRTPLKFQDCSHWCLPGVPDSWNELIYAEILRKHFLDKQMK